MTRQKLFWGLAMPMLIGSIYSCGSSGDSDNGGGGMITAGTGGGGGSTSGGPCDSNDDCSSGVCTNGTCTSGTTTPKPGGSPCGANTECQSGVCLDGTCESGSPGGGSCDTGADCVSGVCQDNECVGNGVGGAPEGSSCSSNSECASGVCTNGTCGAGTSLPDGTSCSSNGECASGVCTNGVCGTNTSGGTGGTTGSGGTGSGTGGTGTGTGGSDNPDASAGTGGTAGGAGGTTSTGGFGGVVVNPGGDPIGSPCTSGATCQSGICINGVCSLTTTGPHWDGSGTGFRPLTSGCGPDTADECTGTCEASGGDPDVDVIRPPATLCFAGPGDETPEDPSVVIEQSIETLDGVTYVHLRVTFDPAFVDNTYGEPVCCGWNPQRPHTFHKDLTGSDHTELLLTNGAGETVMNFKIDYISPDMTASCGYSTLGVTGGDGSVISGDPNAVLAVATSLDRNINGCGYCTSTACGASGDCTIDSPTTDENYTINPLTPDWDYRQVYEVWIDYDAFGSTGFGQGYITYVHASPNKSAVTTIDVVPVECPPTWNNPYCPPEVQQEGGDCFGTPTGGTGGTGGTDGGPGSGGTTSTGGTTGTGGSGGTGTTTCPVNWQIYIATEGASYCTPIPFANYPNMAPCPEGYHLDLATEGQYCLPD